MTTAIERLEELLDERDERVRELEERLEDAERRLALDPVLWALPTELKDARPELPLPRLELLYTPDREAGWNSYVVLYRLLYKHFLGHVIQVAMGRTTISGGLSPDSLPTRPLSLKHRPGCLDLPLRDGAHICHDMATLKLPGYAIAGDHVDDLSALAGKPRGR